MMKVEPAQGADPRHRRRPDRVPADLQHRPPDPGRRPARLQRRARQAVRDRHPVRRHPGRVLGVPRAHRPRRRPGRDRWPTAGAQPVHRLPAAGRCSACCSARRSRPPVQAGAGGAAFIVGAFVILWAERREHTRPRRDGRRDDAARRAQARPGPGLALIPGTSRSGATIIGGLLFGLSRKAATEFSFFLAIPTLIAATVYQLYKERALLSADDLGMWVVGFHRRLRLRLPLRALAAALHLQPRLHAFAWYRIAFGIVVLATWQFDLVGWTASMSAGILYLHGFCSSPGVVEGAPAGRRDARTRAGRTLLLPGLSPVPDEAIAQASRSSIGSRVSRAPLTAGRQFARRLLRDLAGREARSARRADQPGRGRADLAGKIPRHADQPHTPARPSSSPSSTYRPVARARSAR
jgi:hypothetical protein